MSYDNYPKVIPSIYTSDGFSRIERRDYPALFVSSQRQHLEITVWILGRGDDDRLLSTRVHNPFYDGIFPNIFYVSVMRIAKRKNLWLL